MSRKINGRELQSAMIVRNFKFDNIEACISFKEKFLTEDGFTLPATINADGSINMIVCDHYNHAPVMTLEDFFEAFVFAHEIEPSDFEDNETESLPDSPTDI